MLSPDSAEAVPTKNALPEINRRSADFHPSIWGDHFLAYESQSTELDEKIKQQVQELKEKVLVISQSQDSTIAAQVFCLLPLHAHNYLRVFFES
ncbi:(-)-germacrene D synthase [Morella rubra]|uniref:(-)-germacrene D synthase n=1 Tax=Morella rubra TaxID=262757 RepID=A0A6A1UQR7_9ROSI|nr:(-)-germacrene D synthase [Morella rubra]